MQHEVRHRLISSIRKVEAQLSRIEETLFKGKSPDEVHADAAKTWN